MTKVTWGKSVEKQLEAVPPYIAQKFQYWVALVEVVGIRHVRQSKGYHDEPLKGQRLGQRSIRLNRAYRAIYVKRESGELEFLEVLEVNKHEY